MSKTDGVNWDGERGKKLRRCLRDETAHTVRRWVIVGRWGSRAGVGEGASSLARHTVCALPAPSQNATCWYPVCPGRLGSMQLAPFPLSLHSMDVTTIPGAKMLTTSNLPLLARPFCQLLNPLNIGLDSVYLLSNSNH